MLAFVFPGQGAQTVGMGKELAENYPSARAIFEQVDDALSENLSRLIWTGDPEVLKLTQNAQPALMATSLAAMAALRSEGISVSSAAFVAGHSLGEYSALAASGALRIADCARILRIRGLAMQQAVPSGVGAMAAILGLDFDQVNALAKDAALTEVCQAANDNDPTQVVVSGHKAAVERCVKLAIEAGAIHTVVLPVSAPFHCNLMSPAAEIMAKELSSVEITAPAVPIVANICAKPVRKPNEIRDLLIQQVTGSVRWRESVSYMASKGVTEIWEIGSGKTLCGMIRRIDKSIETHSITSLADISDTLDIVGA